MFVVVGNVLAQDVKVTKTEVTKTEVVKTTVATPVMEEQPKVELSEAQKAQQARMQEYMTPNENHAVLKAWEGDWKTHVKFWMDPAAPAQESDGTAQSTMIMNGRFLEQVYQGEMMGQRFEGRAIIGYDNMRKEYTGLWLDNMATGIMVSTAKYDATAKTLTEEGSMSCPITNESHRWYKAVTTWIDADNYTYESYMKDKDGKEFKGMSITYSRIK